MDIKLITPTPIFKNKIMSYKADFAKNNDSLDGGAGLEDTTTFEDWFSALQDNSSEETVRQNRVPATTLLAINSDDEIVGMIDIRHRLNDYLLNFGGHIGYSVIKSQRGKGIATEILRLGLIECKKLDLSKVLITCDKTNIASAKVIIKNGGIFDNEVQEGKKTTQRYWINIY